MHPYTEAQEWGAANAKMDLLWGGRHVVRQCKLDPSLKAPSFKL